MSGDTTIVGLECKNRNRVMPSTCSVSQSYETTKTTSFTLSEGSSTETNSYTEYSWGSSTEEATSDEFSWGLDQSLTVGAEGQGLGFKSSIEVTLGANQQWTSSSSESTSRSSGGGGGDGSSQGTSTGRDNTWETSETQTVTCEAAMDVVPGHSVSYSLVFNSFNTTIRTLTSMKLTLCSALINGNGQATQDDFVYIDDIPGTIEHMETTACEVQFGPAEGVPNEMSCAEEQKLAVAAGETYIPLCRSTDSSLYDGCQCDIGDSRSSDRRRDICWCSDESGDALDDKVHQFSTDISFEEVCVRVLECSDSEVAEPSSAAVAVAETGPLGLNPLSAADSNKPVLDANWVEDLHHLVWVAIATLLTISAAAAMYVVTKCMQCMSRGVSGYQYSQVKQSELTDDEAMA